MTDRAHGAPVGAAGCRLPAADIIRGPEPVEVTGTEAVRRFLGLDTPT
ncbi:hypothetical protein [Brevibacterium sp. XM4083]|nr:hypothetical protein [Brevibacterium sp. XM4083]MCM1014477.1 hypothetical protein [Brevibacterium sp. XM4083]